MQFGTFEVDLQARELRKGGLRIRLQDQPFEILAMMLERPGQLVTREELRRKLWPHGTFVDFEHSLNAAVKRLRSALGDEADNPRFVETLHRRGYRFIAPLAGFGAVASKTTTVAPRVAAVATQWTDPIQDNSEKTRLVVLPFTNMSDDPGQEYFSDGLTEEMIVQIARTSPRQLGVIARTSAMLFKRGGKSAREIGQELRVDYLVEGSVRKDADRVRITAQLIETAHETHLWSETYDRRLDDYFTVQADVAARIAQSLALELVPGQRETIGRSNPRRARAHQAYLKGRFHWNRTADEGLQQAVFYYEQALALDPEFAAAHAALARVRVVLADNWAGPACEVLPGALLAALRSLELDPDLPEGHLALAEIHKSLHWDWTGAESEYRKAIALSPNYEAAHHRYAVFLASMSRDRDATIEAARACDLDPLCLAVYTSAAWVEYLTGDYDAAIERCRHTIEMESGYLPARRLLGAAYLQTGRAEDAIRELEEAARIGGSDPVTMAWLANAMAVSGRRKEAIQRVEKLQEMSGYRYVPSYHTALVHAGLADPDAAFASLNQACEERDTALLSVRVEPRFAPLRADPRYEGLLERLGLTHARQT